METMHFPSDIKVMYVKAKQFPEGIGEALEKIRAIVPSNSERKLFGLSRPEHGKIEYKAAIEVKSLGEAESLHVDSMIVKKGDYISATIHDYMKHVDNIRQTFNRMLKDPEIDPDGYCVEWYISDTEMKCMVRLADKN